jgi:hypothetical protein
MKDSKMISLNKTIIDDSNPEEKIKQIIKEAFGITSVKLSNKEYGFLKPKNQNQYFELVNSSNVVNYDRDNNNVMTFLFI